MKDWFIGLISGIFITLGMFLWLVQVRILGMVLILLAWFLSVIVCGHYIHTKRRA
jgi:hypothetical protein